MLKLKLFIPGFLFLYFITASVYSSYSSAEEDDFLASSIFDDKQMLNGYSDKYALEDKELLLAIIQDETVTPFKTAAAVRVFKEKFCEEIFTKEKKAAERILIRRLNRTDSPFVQVEIMHTLCLMDRYKYFDSMVPLLITKMDHYNDTVNEMAFAGINNIIEEGNNRPREARIIFNILRRQFFLSRGRLANLAEPDPRLIQKFQILRWTLKVLGTQEIRRLPKEVINLL
ncbi:MAG TPA: hypothetical protein PLB05_08100 [Candidatus Omnitrophota bacterium]|jgi:hypothetical protein|nr:hypothetical protein [Candidatus Omnitrophota bacterium]HPN56346.1 hypothetical protein [Candidatus Omnitrophota bacterium]